MDEIIFQKINSFAGQWPLLDGLAIFSAEWLGYVLIVVLFIFFLKKREKYGSVLVRALIAGFISRFVITEAIRFFWERQRPFVNNSVNLLLSHDATPSFPSGHAAFFFGFSALVYLYNKKLGLWFLIASALVALARVFGGVHWPSDVLAGAGVGIISAYLVDFIAKKIKQT